ncbi:protein of unknown function [Methanoculleus bourgensis]|uniref:Uncharacterized protein n=1 Tax=Methanoculleus bourgensis TaxID=83986 RepID=A0A0X3BGM6_9EURY|nr:protein of unknown function [Methanoculleus bourgensis]
MRSRRGITPLSPPSHASGAPVRARLPLRPVGVGATPILSLPPSRQRWRVSIVGYQKHRNSGNNYRHSSVETYNARTGVGSSKSGGDGSRGQGQENYGNCGQSKQYR